LYNYLADKVYSAKPTDAENTLQLTQFDAGVYTLKISSNTEVLNTQSITIIH
jgi:hypothetical protein